MNAETRDATRYEHEKLEAALQHEREKLEDVVRRRTAEEVRLTETEQQYEHAVAEAAAFDERRLMRCTAEEHLARRTCNELEERSSKELERLEKLIQGKKQLQFIPEPVDEWEERGFLGRMYQDEPFGPVKLAFQYMTLGTLTGDWLKAISPIDRTPPTIIITVRSPMVSVNTFGKQNVRGADLEQLQHTYDRLMAGKPFALLYF